MSGRAIWTVVGGVAALGAAVALAVTGVLGGARDEPPDPEESPPWTISTPATTAGSEATSTQAPEPPEPTPAGTLADRLPPGADETVEQLVYDVATELTREDSTEARGDREARLASYFADRTPHGDLRTVSGAVTRLDELDAARVVGEPGPVAAQEFVASDATTIIYRVVVPTTLTVTYDDGTIETYTAAGTYMVTVGQGGDGSFAVMLIDQLSAGT